MKTNANRKLRARVESLETREVLSTSHVTAHLAGHVVSLQGSGTAQVYAQRTLAGGAVEALDNIRGSASGLGSYTGQFDLTLSANQRQVSGSGNLVTSAGQLNFALSGPFTVPKGNSTTARGRLRLTFQGGTNAFANAKGSGLLTLVNDLSTGSAIYKTSGRFRD